MQDIAARGLTVKQPGDPMIQGVDKCQLKALTVNHVNRLHAQP